MTYQEFKKQRQEAYNTLPIKYAFSNEQFKEMLEEWGLTEKDIKKICKLGNTGGFYLKSDAPKIRAWFEANSDDKLDKLMQDEEFAIGAYYYEMCNYEYGINMDGDWDVLRCFGKEKIEELNENQLRFYKIARKKYWKDALKNEWF